MTRHLTRILQVTILLLSALVSGAGAADSGGCDGNCVYLPAVYHVPGWRHAWRGIAGPASAEQMGEVGATWYHHWSACWPRSEQCVDHVKGDSFEAWLDASAILDMANQCESGYIMFGDEWLLQGWPLERQVSALRWFEALAHDEQVGNPECKLIFGGVLAWHPVTKDAGVGWVRSFYDLYLAWYGEAPPVAGVMFDSYYWPSFSRDFVTDTWRMTEEIRAVYGDVEVWIRETGSLESEAAALAAVEMMSEIAPMVDRYAWFTSYEAGSPSLWDTAGELTVIGQALQIE